MELAGLEQPPYATTMMGVLKGALDYHGLRASQPATYGGSGHAWVINIHEQLCPSGPYVWNMERVFELTRLMGVDMRDLGFYSGESDMDARAEVERRLTAALDRGVPCSLCNMEFQLIYGHDEEKLFAAQPWPNADEFTPGSLTFGTWAEFGDECHVNFFELPKAAPTDARTVLLSSLAFAVDAWRRPEAYAFDGYGVGPNAYANWLAAVDEFGASHGNWWNGTVWSECRAMGSAYLTESGAVLPGSADELAAVAGDYAAVAEMLSRAADRELAADEKKRMLGAAAERETHAVNGIEALLTAVTG